MNFLKSQRSETTQRSAKAWKWIIVGAYSKRWQNGPTHNAGTNRDKGDKDKDLDKDWHKAGTPSSSKEYNGEFV